MYRINYKEKIKSNKKVVFEKERDEEILKKKVSKISEENKEEEESHCVNCVNLYGKYIPAECLGGGIPMCTICAKNSTYSIYGKGANTARDITMQTSSIIQPNIVTSRDARFHKHLPIPSLKRSSTPLATGNKQFKFEIGKKWREAENQFQNSKNENIYLKARQSIGEIIVNARATARSNSPYAGIKRCVRWSKPKSEEMKGDKMEESFFSRFSAAKQRMYKMSRKYIIPRETKNNIISEISDILIWRNLNNKNIISQLEYREFTKELVYTCRTFPDFNPKEMHQACDSQGSLIILIYLRNSRIIGSFISLGWISNLDYIYDPVIGLIQYSQGQLLIREMTSNINIYQENGFALGSMPDFSFNVLNRFITVPNSQDYTQLQFIPMSDIYRMDIYANTF